MVFAQNVAQNHLNRIGKQVCLGLVVGVVAGGDSLWGRDVDLKESHDGLG